MNEQTLPSFLQEQRVVRCSTGRDGQLTLFFGPQITIETCQGTFHDLSQWVLTLFPPIQYVPTEKCLPAPGCILQGVTKTEAGLLWQFSTGGCCIQRWQPSLPRPFSLAYHDPNGTNVVSSAAIDAG